MKIISINPSKRILTIPKKTTTRCPKCGMNLRKVKKIKCNKCTGINGLLKGM